MKDLTVQTTAPVCELLSLRRLPGSKGHELALTEQQATQWGYVDRETVTLATGSARVQAVVRIALPPNAGYIALAGATLDRLGLEARETVHVMRKDDTLRLGPLVGILAPRRLGHSRPYQAQTSLFKRMIAAGREMGIPVFIFDFHDIRWTEKRVRGYTFTGSSWVARTYPLPDVVFDRATGSFPGGSSAADLARRRLVRNHGIKLFNTRLGSKWRLYRIMHSDPELRRHLPATHKATSAAVAGVMSRHQGAYIKPLNGAQGKRIIRLRRVKGRIAYTLTTDSYRQVRGSATTVAGALALLRGHTSLAGYLVQPDLNLIRLRGRICDVRVLVQRDDSGEWRVTGMGVRVGQPGSVVSNLHGGGRALQVEAVLNKAMGLGVEEARAKRAEMERLALRVAQVLAKSARCLGELGVDLGIDQHGRVWIIEANSRTGRATFRRAGLTEAGRLADRRPLLFAKYLAGFTSN